MLTFTPAAIDAARQALASSSEPFVGIRLIAEGGGCSGSNFQLGLEDTLEGDDTKVDFDGLTVILDAGSASLSENVTVDFVDDDEGPRFVIHDGSPRKSGGGGCGCSCSGGGEGGHRHGHGHGHGHHHHH